MPLVVTAILGMTGCTVTSFDRSTLHDVPSDRVYLHQESLPEEAIVEVVRLNNFATGGCYLTFLINGQRAARLDTNEVATFHLKPGEYVFHNTYDWDGRALCGVYNEQHCRTMGQIRRQTIEGGKKYTFRMGVNFWSGVLRLYTDSEGIPLGNQ